MREGIATPFYNIKSFVNERTLFFFGHKIEFLQQVNKTGCTSLNSTQIREIFFKYGKEMVRVRCLFLRKQGQTLGAKAIVKFSHDQDHLLFMDLIIFAPAIILTGTGKLCGTTGTDLFHA